MSEEKKFETLEDIIEYMKPNTVFVVVEMDPKDLVIGDGDQVATKTTDFVNHAVRCIEIVERVRAVDDKITVRNGAVYLQPTPEGHAKLMNRYVFIDSPGALKDISLSDLTFVYRLDGKCEITHFPSNANKDTPILPHHIVK